MCTRCNECQKLKASAQKETLGADELPERPFDVVSADLFYVGRKVYMIYADRLSGYTLVSMWTKDPNTNQVIRQLQQYFSLFGKPLKFRSDGGPQFDNKEMSKFLEDYCIEPGQSSPYNPQSNGHAERNVAIIKQLILKTDGDINSKQFLDGVAQLRNTPRADGYSPCQVVFGRAVRTLIPTLTEALGTNEFVEKARRRKKLLDHKQKVRYDRNAKDLKPLEPETLIWVQNSETKKWDDTAKIICRIRKRTYKIKMENGRITYRSRQRIRRRESSLNGSWFKSQKAISDRCDNNGHRGQNTMGASKHGSRGQNTMKEDDVEPKPRRSERIMKATNKL